ncbi:hypothetical protein NUW58_g2924 [Xylaria curta]|uniref:Uncharacterized protein n=1 Tax=Xylaria curta TaxID=42375 RepID=A0ACC1PE92_9PEZI|nr:hypothetical protein NUW58_g2924 [Xylaria curta]
MTSSSKAPPPASTSSTPTSHFIARLKPEDVNPQLASPLFQSRIPPEIRNKIFEFAVTEPSSVDDEVIELVSDMCVQQSHDPLLKSERPANLRDGRLRPWDPDMGRKWEDQWLRFDNIMPMRVETALLMTCRRAYLDTRSLPLLQAEQRFWCYHSPIETRGLRGEARSNIKKFVEDYLSETIQRELVGSVRLFAHQSWLAQDFLPLVESSLWFPNIEHLRITIRNCDWLSWENQESVVINPFRTGDESHNINLMHGDMKTDARDVQFAPGAWGSVFSHMPKLKTLTIDFEMTKEMHTAVVPIVGWALKWRFPLQNGRHLSTGNRPPHKMSWRALPDDWSYECTACDARLGRRLRGVNDCGGCVQAARFRISGYGPQFLIWTCVWKSVTEFDKEDVAVGHRMMACGDNVFSLGIVYALEF